MSVLTPETVAVTEVAVVPETFHVYSQTEAEAVAAIATLVATPLRLMAGAAVMASEKRAVIVTVCVAPKIKLSSEAVKLTVILWAELFLAK